MKKTITFLKMTLCLLVILNGFYGCQEELWTDSETDSVLLKKGKMPNDVQFGDLYGDLCEIERENSGVPKIYPLKYAVEYQDEPVTGIIDVTNPRLDGSFSLEILVRNGDGYVIYTDPLTGGEPVPETENVMIDPGDDGFLNESQGEYSPIVLYDAEGELFPDVALHIFPVEEGRLNLVRSPGEVLSSRMTEVLGNFGDGTVANVIKDYCGRLYMLRTETALAEGIEDKPIDSPLENMALYYELMIYGFSRSAEENGLRFLVNFDDGFGGFNFQSRLDNSWGAGAFDFGALSDDQQKKQFVANLAAACVAASSDKSNFLTFDEISYLNQFLGIPKVEGNDINTPATSLTCFFPTLEQEVRMMDKTDKSQYSKYKYYVDFSEFSYTRDKFVETLIDYYTIVGDYDDDGNLIGSHKEILPGGDDLTLHDILMGSAPLTVDALETYRYTQKENQATTGMLGFANQADDYVQALEVIHDNEEFLEWEMPTPTWDKNYLITRPDVAPFIFNSPEESHSKKPDGKGDDESTDSKSGSGRRGR